MSTPPHPGGDHSPKPSNMPGDAPAGAPGRSVRFTFDGREVWGHQGESVAAALLAAGHRLLRITGRRMEPRGLFCGMGVCFDCLVQIDGRSSIQACRTSVAQGMCVQTQRGFGSPEPLP
jgi:predicted molibdopterin-dependent oxidoreductase YjgC